jgi:hypothetical protein
MLAACGTVDVGCKDGFSSGSLAEPEYRQDQLVTFGEVENSQDRLPGR